MKMIAEDFWKGKGRYSKKAIKDSEVDQTPIESENDLHECACGCGEMIAADKTWVKGHHKRRKVE
ncbi:MAG: hypothetical protein WC476_01620 [Phycisphaerae bacterium]|jgi:hypothetical protein